MNTIKRAGVMTTAAFSALLWVGVPVGATGETDPAGCADASARVAPAELEAHGCAPCVTHPLTPCQTTTTEAPETTTSTTAPEAPPESPAPTPTPADLDCGDPGTTPDMPVEDGDPHELDADDDGVGCEAPEPAPAAAPVVAQPTYTG